ncbi:MAG: class I tRNA ligase family protein [Giesbergeria sp.]
MNSGQGKPEYVFYEGPPTANGRPGVHHVLARAFKDMFPRYKIMRGYHVSRRGGWDTHGLPVEIEVEKQLGFTNKQQIEEYGIDKFNAALQKVGLHLHSRLGEADGPHRFLG